MNPAKLAYKYFDTSMKILRQLLEYLTLIELNLALEVWVGLPLCTET